ncbi:MAG: von Willebrand factor type A domain-containing protein [Planctomycetota bacterium]|jgi:Ca-activated chloride channel family protein|nr:hypothetical protein [Planctomycetota bacterium]MDP6407938.1 von Willebrand factor type A domain-containing protein [Planctomycetota bacterium]MDP6540930.1 von Willebrand factor type A domain-containing protein [Planctomycetota bacterium]
MNRDEDLHMERDETHELLCALVLGELGAEDRVRIEAALAESEELQAERARIEATIGLVRGAYSGSEGLSPGAVSELEERAGAAPRAMWTAGGLRAAAAVVLILCGAVIALRALDGVRERGANEARLARNQAPAAGSLESYSVSAPMAESEAREGRSAPRPSAASSSSTVPRGGPAPVDGGDLGGTTPSSAGATYRGPSDTVPSTDQAPATAPAQRGAAQRAAGVVLDRPSEAPTSPPAERAAPEATRRSLMSSQSPDLRAGRERFFAAPSTPVGGDGGGAAPDDYLHKVSGVEGNGAVTGAGEFLLDGVSAGEKLTARNRFAPASPAPPAPPGAAGPAGPSTSGPSGAPPAPTAGLVARGAAKLRAPAAGRVLERLGEPLAREGDHAGPARKRLSLGLESSASDPARVDQLLGSCRRRPGERPGAMFFRFWGDNPFELTALDAQSTFGVDVDTASYALARRMLNEGLLPTREQVRTEEFLNYFKPDVLSPEEGVFSIHTDLAASRFAVGIAPRSGRVEQPHQLRVVVRGREVSRTERKPLALTFVVDTSGSMKKDRRLELVKHALRQLVGQLDGRDAIALVAFSNEARLVLPMTSAANRGVIEAAVFGLHPDGGTNADAGIRLGFELAVNELTLEANNRVVFLSDGVANIGETDQGRIAEAVGAHREKGIYLNTVGVGLGNHNDVFLEQLADRGDGICNYVDSPEEVQRALVDNFTGAFEPIARDVKVQVEFDPRFVHRWRLLGYENRAIADVDFRNDSVDAGEVGAGHQIVALYELDLNDVPAAADPPLATVRLRWKRPSGPERDPLEDSATEIETNVNWSSRTTFEGASAGFRRSVCVAQFAEILRRSYHARNDSLDELISVAATLERELADPDHLEFLSLMVRTRALIRQAPYHTPGVLERSIDGLRRNRILDCEYSELSTIVDDGVIAELERQNRELSDRIRELMRQEAGGR